MKNAQPLRAGLVGSNIGKTRFGAAMREMCGQAGIALQFELIDTGHSEGFDFEEKIRTLIERGWDGISVTHPYKLQAAGVATGGMAEASAGLNAANLLIFGDDGATGHNTDHTGFLEMWGDVMGGEPPGRVAMAGAGGVGSAIGHALAKLGASRISIWDIRADRAEQLARAIGGPAQAVRDERVEAVVGDADGLVNATALGMAPYAGSAFNPAWLTSQRWAFDAVYTPAQTPFLRAAEATGITSISGFELFKHMAIRSFEAYTGIVPNVEATLKRLDDMRPAAAGADI